MQLADKTALVTGGSRGIGKAIAKKLAACGAAVAVVYAGNDKAAAEAVREIETAGGRAKAYRCNVADFEATAATAQQITEDFGGVDILVNNAGVVRDGLLMNQKEEDFDAVVEVNLKGAYNLTRHLSRQFIRRRTGRIINITSVIGLMGNAGQANYAAAKAGLIGLTKSTARELASRGITCNAIAPGMIESDMTDAVPEKAREEILKAVPMRRAGRASEVADLAAFLASDAAGYITGEVIRVDGGLAM